jgi:phosphoglycerate kinase
MNTNLSQISNSIVLVRVNYDLPDRDHLARVFDSRETIDQLLSKNNKVVLLSHWGRPRGEDFRLSFKNLVLAIGSKLKNEIFFINQFESFFSTAEEIRNSSHNLFLLENTRFDPDERSKDSISRQNLAKKYAQIGDYFVDEAFAVSHRKEATNYYLAELLPSLKGLSFQHEIDNLSVLKSNPVSPYIVIMAGSKLETKLPVVEKMLAEADNILLGGKLCFTFLQAAKNLNLAEYQNVDFGNAEIETGFLDKAAQLLQKYGQKIQLSVDFVYGNRLGEVISENQENKFAFDVGSKTVEKYIGFLSSAKTIFWNGTLGYYEKIPFNQATLKIGNFLTTIESKIIIGGGDTVSALAKEVTQKYDFVSMGGGATLYYLIKD